VDEKEKMEEGGGGGAKKKRRKGRRGKEASKEKPLQDPPFRAFP